MQRLPLLFASVNKLWRSKKFPALAGLGLVSLVVVLMTTRFMELRSSAHLDNSAGEEASNNPTAQGGCCSTQPNTLRRMIGSYYNTEDDFVSTLTLNNKGAYVIAVTPILHGKNGQTFTAGQVLVNPESSMNVDLNAIASTAGPNFKSGSFEFTYLGRMMELGGGLRIVNTAKSLIFDEQMLEPGMKFSSPQLEAVYAIPSVDAEVNVILTNTTSQALSLNGDATFVGTNGHHPINGSLSPNETSIVKLPKGLVNQSTAGAVSITHNGASGALLAMIHVSDQAKGFSAAVNFTDPAQGKTTQLHGTGLRLGSVNNAILKPVIAVRNIGNTATTVNARIPLKKQNGTFTTITLPPTSLAAGETKILNTANPTLTQTEIATAGLELEYTGAFGSVIATVHSVSPDGNQVFTVPMKDPQGGMSSTGGYPWFVNGTASTVVFIKNTTTSPQRFHLDIVYSDQGVLNRWGSNTRLLAAGETTAFDVRKIRDSQETGSEGNTIPITANSGHVAWSYLGDTDKVFIGRSQTVDTANGLVSTYECQCNCGYSYYESRLLPSSISGFIGGVTNLFAQERDWLCYNTYSSFYDVNYKSTFSSQYPTIASCNGNIATAIGTGTTSLYASFGATQKIWTGFGCSSIPKNIVAPTTCTVQPIQLNWNSSQGDLGIPLASGTAPQGSSPYVDSITITATANPASGTWSWTTTSNKVTLLNATSATVTVKSVTQSDAKGDVPIKFTYTYNGTAYPFSSSINCTVQKPTTYAWYATYYDRAFTGCGAGSAGWEKGISWQLTDHLGSPISRAIPCWDTMDNIVPNNCFVPAQGEGTPPGPSTNNNGIWAHNYSICSTACVNGGMCVQTGTQNYTVNGYSIALPFTMSCNSITVAGK